MKFVPMITLLNKALAEGYAVPSFCVWNAETMMTVLKTAKKLDSPVILMNGPGEFPLLPPEVMGKTAHSLPVENPVPSALHLDHGDSLEQVRACIDAGYTSVMLDFSSKTFDENAGALKEVVKIAHPLGITVEGEIGSVGKVGDSTLEGGMISTLTDPDEAYEYAVKTGVDTLAISIGNAHGHYTKLPEFRFDILSEVYSRVKIPIVLHGGSGTPDEDIKKAISLGIAKVNVASELNSAFRDSLKTQWNSGLNPWSPLAMTEALKYIGTVVEKWIIRLGSAGKA